MKPIRTAIIDDEPLARRLIRSLVRHDDALEMIGEADCGESAIDLIRSYRPDLVFLDVEMPHCSGIDVLRAIDEEQLPYVIFITAFDDYAVQAFEQQAVDYLLKPISKERFYRALDRAKQRMQQENLAHMAGQIAELANQLNGQQTTSQILNIKVRNTIVPINTRHIIWLEAANQYVTIHTADKSYLVSDSLTAMEKKLDPNQFVRIHRSAIVAAEQVAEIQTADSGRYQITLKNGASMTLARSRRARLQQLLQHLAR